MAVSPLIGLAPLAQVSSGFLGALVEPGVVAASAVSFLNDPTRLPDPQAIIQAAIRGFIPSGLAKWGLEASGANFGRRTATANDANRNALWLSMPRLLWQRPDIETILTGYLMGLPGVDANLKLLLQESGGSLGHWKDVLDALRNYPTVGQLMEALNRDFIDGLEFTNMLRKTGRFDDSSIELFGRLREQLPPPTDFERFAIKEALDPIVSRDRGLYREFPEAFNRFMGLHGFTGATGYTNPVTGREATWAEIHWAAHWFPISPTQAYEMLHRIREDKNYDIGGVPTPLKAFTAKDVDAWLKIADYPPDIRNYLAAISYRPITRIDLRRLWKTKVLTARNDLIEGYLDLGYDRQNATRLTDFVIKDAQLAKARPYVGRYRKAIYEAYKTGALDRGNADAQLINTYPDETDAKERDLEIASTIAAIDIEVSLDGARRAIRSLRADFLEGAVSLDEARSQLLGMGITQQRTEQYLNNWRLDLNRPRVVASTTKVLDWYKWTLIDRNEAYGRLYNLGLREKDIQLHLRKTDLDRRLIKPPKDEEQKNGTPQEATTPAE